MSTSTRNEELRKSLAEFAAKCKTIRQSDPFSQDCLKSSLWVGFIPPGSPWGEDRDNDKHLTLAEKRAARGEA